METKIFCIPVSSTLPRQNSLDSDEDAVVNSKSPLKLDAMVSKP